MSQMPVVLLPLHFDRHAQQRPSVPSCQRSVVVRTFITSDFMTGIPATPGKHLPLEVSVVWLSVSNITMASCSKCLFYESNSREVCKLFPGQPIQLL